MNLKSNLSPFISRLCVALLTLLGFNCCSDAPCMYGSPTGSFEIKGSVTNEEGDPVKEAIIRVSYPSENSGLWSITRSITNEWGVYKATGSSSPIKELKIVCIPPGNIYEPDSVMVPMTYSYDKDHKKDSWYEGHATATVDFKLKSKEGE